MNLHSIAKENRPRERMQNVGAHALSDAELLAIILQSASSGENVIDMCNRLLFKHPLATLPSLSTQEFMNIRGIGPAKALKIKAAFELAKRARTPLVKEKIIKNPQDIIDHYKVRLEGKKKEYLFAVFLDTKLKIIGEKLISIGTLSSTLAHPREVFKEAIRMSAHAIILVHNHPSGDISPSPEDEEITRVFRKAGEIVGIAVLDHVIV